MKSVDGYTPANLLNIILADDDRHDCILFKHASGELPMAGNFTALSNGVQPIQLQSKQNKQADKVCFPGVNLPQINDFNFLNELKGNCNFNQLLVSILPTSYRVDRADLLYKKGAYFYILKPSSFVQLKNPKQPVTIFSTNKNILQSSREKSPTGSNQELISFS